MTKLSDMNITDWLEAEKGRAAALAAHFGKTPAAVSQWKRNGVPLDLMKSIRDFTGGAVTLEEMVPEPAGIATEPDSQGA
jgi:DNA-binding transcriptional regulator YdaS (Cro superfamily)